MTTTYRLKLPGKVLLDGFGAEGFVLEATATECKLLTDEIWNKVHLPTILAWQFDAGAEEAEQRCKPKRRVKAPAPWLAKAPLTELPIAPNIEVGERKSPLTASDQPMPDHLDPAERTEIELLLLRIFRQDLDAIRFLGQHNARLRAKPLDLIQRDHDGVVRVLAYLREAAGNCAPTSIAGALE